jgi:hypothetical protein
MARVVESTGVEAEQISFELDRFALTGDDRLEVRGRWFGVRGRRFVRPTLTVLTAGGSSRSLADLAHKPWAAEDGQPWTAEFSAPGDGGELLEVELAVAPDIEVTLPAPGQKASVAKRRTAAPAARTAVRGTARSRPRVQPGPPSVSSHQLNTLRDELASARREIERLTAALASAEGAQVEASAALARRDAVLTELEGASAELERASAELESASAERDAAVQARDLAVADLAQARRSREELQSHLEELTRQVSARDGRLEELLRVVADRDARLAELASVATDRDAALAELAAVAADRDAALAARDQAISQRQALAESLERLESERAALSSARGAALVMHDSAKFSGVHRRDLDWISRGLAVVLLLAALCAVAIIAHLV